MRLPSWRWECRFERKVPATVSLPGGKPLTVVARNLSKENRFVKRATFNGKPLCKTIEHADIMAGGELAFEMTGSPSSR